MAMLLRHDDGGQNLLMKGVEDQWRYIDKKHYDPKTTYNENFISFIDALVQYFKNMYVPLLDGTTVVFRDMGREEMRGRCFRSTTLKNTWTCSTGSSTRCIFSGRTTRPWR